MIYKAKQEAPNEKYITYDQMNIIIAFEKLWLKIAIWIRTYIRSVIFDTRDKNSIANYLIALPNEFYPIFSLFYGTTVAQNIVNLLVDFIKSSIEVVEYMKYGESELANSSIIKWYQTADKLSSYLARINIYWDEYQWKFLLYQYIKLKIDGINAIIQDDYKKEVELYNMLDNIIFLMGSYMARGIISSSSQQIPNQIN